MGKSEIKRVWPESDDTARVRRESWAAARKIKEQQAPPEIWVRRVARALFGLKAGDGGRPRRYPGYSYLMHRSLNLKRRERTVRIDGLPRAFDGYRILHLTDLHLDHLPRLPDALAEALEGVDVDLALISGDFQENERADPSAIARLVSRALAPLKAADGVMGILGNHDSARLVGPLEAIGVRLVINEVFEVRRGQDVIHIAGTDDVHYFASDSVEETLVSGPDGVRIALMHSPERADLACRRHALLLCGHTHAGQICLPGGLPLVTGLKRHKRYVRGVWKHGAMTGYTGSGVGTTLVPFRINCPGEVVVFTLRA